MLLFRPVIKGPISESDPPFYSEPLEYQPKKQVNYTLMSLAKPPLEIDAWSCLQWNATKTIKSFFWGSTDTTSGKIIHAVSPRECILAAQPPFLCGNQHTETDGKNYKIRRGTKRRWNLDENDSIFNPELFNKENKADSRL